MQAHEGDSCLCEKGLRRSQRSGTVAGNEAGQIRSDPLYHAQEITLSLNVWGRTREGI